MHISSQDERHAYEALEALRAVIDPELGIDIVSLGLLYRLEADADRITVDMTLTVPGCPMHATITNEVRETLQRLPWVGNAAVNLVFTPPWTPDRLSDDARRRLGRA